MKTYTEAELKAIESEDIKDPRYRILYKKLDRIIELLETPRH